MYEREKLFVSFIKKIDETPQGDFSILEKTLSVINQKDENNLKKFADSFLNLQLNKRKKLINTLSNIFSVIDNNDNETLFNFLSQSQKKITKYIKSNKPQFDKVYYLKIKNENEEMIEDIKQNNAFKNLKRSKSLQKFFKIFENYCSFLKNLITFYNRELSSFTKTIANNIPFNIVSLHLKLTKLHPESTDTFVSIRELHETRNIIEHHNFRITETYIKKTDNKINKNKIGDFLIITPQKITEFRSNIYKYAYIIASYDFENEESIQLNDKYIEKQLNNNQDYISSLIKLF